MTAPERVAVYLKVLDNTYKSIVCEVAVTQAEDSWSQNLGQRRTRLLRVAPICSSSDMLAHGFRSVVIKAQETL